MVAVPLKKKILLFGGHHACDFYMYVLTEDGDFIENLSEIENIPGSLL